MRIELPFKTATHEVGVTVNIVPIIDLNFQLKDIDPVLVLLRVSLCGLKKDGGISVFWNFYAQ